MRPTPRLVRRTLASGPFFLAAVPLGAQAPVLEPADGPVIVVTGRSLEVTPATPAYGSVVLQRDQLLTTASNRIEDALASVAGFQQFRRSDSRSSNPSAQGITLRALGGNASSRAQLLLDGVPMGDPFFGYIPFSAITPERLESARVTRGGGSGPFGAGALTGTIELTSAGIATLGPFSGQAFVNDRGETELAGTISTRLGAGFATVSTRWDWGRGFWTTPAGQRVAASVPAAYDSWSTQVRAVAPLGPDIELQARLLAYNDERTLRFAGADTSMEGQDASLRVVGRGRWQFDAIAYVQARNFTNVVISSTAFRPTLDQRNTPATGLGGKFELRPPTGPTNVLRLGLDYRKAGGELFENALSTASGAVTLRRNAGGTNTDLGLFAENDMILGAVTLTAGVRADRYAIRDGFFVARTSAGTVVTQSSFPERSGWEGSLRGGIVGRVTAELRLRAAAYSGLRLPTLNELYRPFTVFPVTTQANAELRNERLEGFEVGADFSPGRDIELGLTAFDNRVKRAIANVTVGPNQRQRQNVDAVAARGIEASAALRRGAFSLAGSLALTDAAVRASGIAAALDGKRPAQTPRWSSSATLGWRPAPGILLSTTLRHVGAQFEDDLESDILPAATTIDAFAQLRLSRSLALVARGENLANEQILTRNQGGSIDLGAPRTIWLGLKLGS